MALTETEIMEKEQAIRDLQAELTATDYKVIKCYECSLIGETAPYDAQALHSERQAIRDKINALQNELKDYGY